ncbi:MAG TPA: exodeoxyribonuclease VII large subunit [Anaeromyxobacteraceae bacterium]|nr:exodeoxyribonuclease VII large subunit [Anaeromyxobacteraceae bacterium]
MPRPAPPPQPGLFDRPPREPASRESSGREPSGREPPSREPKVLAVAELTRRLKVAVEPPFSDVWVGGEVGNLRRQPSGHVYFGLKDAEASVDAVLWASTARRVRMELKDGMEVVARGRIEIYAPRGRYQLVVQEVEPRGAGARAVALQQLKERLAAEGLLDPARKRPLPFLPTRIGVATSTSGAALQDFLRVVRARFPGARVVVAGCRVQGEGAAATVVSALRLLVDAGVDVAVVTRGGGSADDLWEFNDERLARAIAACPVPVVSAVGHEVDVTVADLVADVRAATPTHAAEVVVPVRDDLEAALAQLRGRLVRAGTGAVAERRRVLRALRAELTDPRRLLSDQRRRVDEAIHRLGNAVSGQIRASRSRLAAAGDGLRRREPRALLRELRARAAAARERLAAWQAATFRRETIRLERLRARLEPANVARMLQSGFALALRDGRPLRRSADAAPGDAIRIVLGEGWLDTRVASRDAPPDPLPGLPPRGEEA